MTKGQFDFLVEVCQEMEVEGFSGREEYSGRNMMGRPLSLW